MAGTPNVRRMAGGGAGRRAGCCATAITRFTKVPPAPLSEYQFRHPEIIAVDPALMADPGNHSCHSTPRKPDPPRHWDQRD